LADRQEKVLKITIRKEAEMVTLQLEGRVTGPRVNELRDAFSSVVASVGFRKLVVDLRGVTHMNADGRQVLADIHRKTRAEFLAETPMTRYFAEEARGLYEGPDDKES
jgi:hypothetical protein